jgi:hypothetical protein
MDIPESPQLQHFQIATLPCVRMLLSEAWPKVKSASVGVVEQRRMQSLMEWPWPAWQAGFDAFGDLVMEQKSLDWRPETSSIEFVVGVGLDWMLDALPMALMTCSEGNMVLEGMVCG